MRKIFTFFTVLVLAFGVSGCRRSLDYIIEHEANVVGIVEEVGEDALTLYCEYIDGYLANARCVVSLNVEYEDSMTDFEIGDEVVVYYDGNVSGYDILNIETVYAITLQTPADSAENE